MKVEPKKISGTGVRSALIPLPEGYLLLPNAVVAEVIGYREPVNQGDAPDWLLGRIDWREKPLPVVSYERMIGRGVDEVGHRARIIVVYGLGGEGSDLPYYGILAQTIPRLSQVSEENIEEHPDAEENAVIAAHVLVDGEEAWIPNVDRLSLMLAEANA